MADAIKISISLDTSAINQAAGDVRSKLKSALDDVTVQAQSSGKDAGSALSGGIAAGAVAAVAAIGTIVASLKQVGQAAIESAIQIDKSRQTIAALVGSTEAANKKLAELRDLARTAPGVTASLAADAFGQLKASAGLADDSINKFLRSFGKLNSVFNIEDSKGFIRNLTQVFTQGFERADIKEAIGRVPIFNQILQQAFGTNDPDKLRKLKDSGKLTIDAFFSGISDAIRQDARFASVQESLGVRFEKARDAILVALEPVGKQLADLLLPVLSEVGPVVEKLAATFSSELGKSKDDIIALGRQVRALGEDVGGVAGELNKLSGGRLTLDLKQEFSDLRVLLAALQDAAELFASVLLRGLQTVAAFIETGLQRALSFVGVQIQSLDDSLSGLLSRIAGNDSRLAQGFSNLRKASEDFRVGSEIAGLSPERRQLLGLFGGDIAGFGGAAVAITKTPPASPASGIGSGKSAADGLAAARQLRQAELARERSDLENQAKLAKDIYDQELKDLKFRYDEGLVLTRDYYNEKYEIAKKGALLELGLLNQQAADIRDQLSKAKGPERLRLLEQLGDVATKIELKQRAIFEASAQSLRDFRAEILKTLKDPNLDLQETPRADKGPLREQTAIGLGSNLINSARQRERDLLIEVNDLRKRGLDYGNLDVQLRIQEVQIQNQVNAGVLTESEGRQATLAVQRQFRDALIASLDAQRQLADAQGDISQVNQLSLQIENLRSLGLELSNTQRFIKGIGSETDSIGDIFERFGKNVSASFRNIGDVFNSLKNAVKSFFSDLLGNSIQGLLRNTMQAIFGSTSRTAAGAGSPGVIGQILSAFTGGGAAAGGGAGVASISSNQQVAAALASISSLASGGGLASVGSLGGALPLGGALSSLPLNPGFSGTPLGQIGQSIGGARVSPLVQGLQKIFGKEGFISNNFLGNTFGGGNLVSLGPALLGAGLGASLGGKSLLGNVLGGIGGAAAGLGLSYGASVFGALGGGFGALGPAALAALGPIALIGAPLLIGALLLGRAKQRGADERQSGDWLQQAIDGVRALKSQVESGGLDLSSARAVFESQILGTFIQQVNTLKTKSVRESRLTNQVRDLRKLFEDEVVPAAAAAKQRQTVAGKLIPEFATGGIVPGIDHGYDSVRALVRPGEMVLTRQQQSIVQGLAGPGIFSAAGVPGAAMQQGGAEAFAFGGVAGNSWGGSRGGGDIYIDAVELHVSEDDATRIYLRGARSADGQEVTVRTVRQARKNGDL